MYKANNDIQKIKTTLISSEEDTAKKKGESSSSSKTSLPDTMGSSSRKQEKSLKNMASCQETKFFGNYRLNP